MLTNAKLRAHTPIERVQYLEEAFERFNEAGARLEERYQSLLSETEQLREQLQEKDREVKRAEKLALLGETAAAIAHEVRNPLGAIKLFISLLRRDVAGNSSAEGLVNQIDKSIVSLDHVVSNILLFAGGKKLAFAPTNIHALVQEQLIYFRPHDRETSIFELELSGNPFILGSESALRQILHNLLLNAVQATKNSGVVSIRCVDRPNGDLELSVADSGPGIPEHILGRIFEPFVTSKQEGTGLGLAIVKQLLTEHGASISAENRGGAVITCVFSRQRAK